VKPSAPIPDPRPPGENGAWEQIRGVWRHLHGSFPDLGISIEWHDFRLDEEMDWGRSFHPGSLEICLNFSGSGILQDGTAERAFGPNQVILYTLQSRRLRARRTAESMHRFLTVELSPEFLHRHFSAEIDKLKPAVRRFVQLGVKAPPYLEIKPLPAGLLQARTQFVEPPVPVAARRAWYLGRVLEILAQTLFIEEEPGEFFCEKHHRTNRERVERVCFLIERDLENPPSLEMLAQEADCSPFHLSRIFARETGASIPKFLRMKRIEKAASIIKSGAMNVTDAAMAVGYSSLGSFTKAFVEQMGCCPGLYPIGKLSRPQISTSRAPGEKRP
jgi:AraC family transcriptional regulator